MVLELKTLVLGEQQNGHCDRSLRDRGASDEVRGVGRGVVTQGLVIWSKESELYAQFNGKPPGTFSSYKLRVLIRIL